MPRSSLLDNVKGVLIFLVVFTHFLVPYVYNGAAGTAVDSLFYFVYCFHMPFFVFISGYFSKNTEKARDTAFMRSLVPFVFFNTTMMLILYAGGARKFSLVTPIHVNWYLLALFAWRVLLQDLVKIRFILPLSLVAALAIGFSAEVTNYLALTRVVAFLPFFLLGYYTSPKAIDALRRAHVVTGLLGLGLAAGVVHWLTHNDALSLSMLLADPYQSTAGFYMRGVFFALALFISACIFIVTPAKRIPVLTVWGENTLLIYVLHRYATLAFHVFVPESQWRDWYVLPVLVCSVVTTWVLGRPAWMRFYNAATQWLSRHCLVGQTEPSAAVRRGRGVMGIRTLVVLTAVVVGLFPLVRAEWPFSVSQPVSSDDPIHPVISASLMEKIDSEALVAISFVGDLILLEDQIKHAFDPRTKDYDFSPIFEYTADRLRAADYTIGVFEIPLAGDKAGYSTSNYDDGIPLHLNAPDTWAEAVKNSGIDLVTTANNHVFDRGIAGARRTLDVLDRIGLDHVGTYRSAEDRRRRRVFVAEVKGVRLAFVAYTYGVNYRGDASAEPFVDVLASPKDKTAFKESRRMVAEDVKEARRHKPDLIIALPHMGTQFLHHPDSFSETWAREMIAEGIDVVLACHSHAVQPMQYLNVTRPDGSRRNGFVVYCPGNFVNSYTLHDGDAAAIVTIHVEKSPKATSIRAASIVPLWIQRRGGGQFSPIPIVDALRRPELRETLGSLDIERIAQVHEIVTETMLGRRLTVDQLQERYFYLPARGYARQPLDVRLREPAVADRPDGQPDERPDGQPDERPDGQPGEELDSDRAELHRVLSEARKVVVLGDSISEGTKNGGYSWIEPVRSFFPKARFFNISRGGRTTVQMIAALPEVPDHDADAVVLALGVNDVRYRDARECAMTKEEYVANVDRLVAEMRQKNPRARFVMLSLWPAFDNDIHSRVRPKLRDRMIDDYNASLLQYCRENNHLFIDASTPIREFLRPRVTKDYLLDHIHPNADKGVRLYGNAVLFGKPELWRIAM